jgi:hypothetical protein
LMTEERKPKKFVISNQIKKIHTFAHSNELNVRLNRKQSEKSFFQTKPVYLNSKNAPHIVSNRL